MQRGGEILEVRNGIAVGGGNFVQGTVVTTWAPITGGLLGHHVKCRCPVAGGGLDDAQLQHVFKLLASNAEALR